MSDERTVRAGADQKDADHDDVSRLTAENERLRRELESRENDMASSSSARPSDEQSTVSADQPLATIVAEIDKAVRRNPGGGMMTAFGVGLIAARLLRGGR